VRYEVQLHKVSNWQIYALQTEEERGEGPFALPLEINDSSDITVANFHIYRVISMFQPFPWAVKLSNSRNIRFRNIHCYSNSKVSFDAAVYDQTYNREIRQREFAWLNVSGNPPAPRVKTASKVLAPAAKVEKLAGGFYNISGGAADPAGDFYFVDAHWQRIYRWSAATRRLSTVADAPLDPVNLAFDKTGNLMALSYTGNGVVYSVRPGGDVVLLKAESAAPRPGLTAVLPVSDWHITVNEAAGTTRPRTAHYLSPDGTTFVSTGQDFASGALSWGVKSADVLRGFGLAPAAPGKPFYMTSEADVRTYSAKVGDDGNFTQVKLFAEQGGEGVTSDARGNVYIAAGNILVYDAAGKFLETIEVPERPLQLVFGGKDGRTLFIPARTALYSVRIGGE
jgi:sugar lactone lactonase YvrE